MRRLMRLKKVAQAIADSQKLLGPVIYQDGAIVMESGVQQPSSLHEAPLDKRVMARLAFQDSKRQSYIESISQKAALELREETSVPNERADTDWITRFFRIAEDITSEQMQALWRKVLAGEVKKPGTYALRKNDLLKNITQREAEIFVKAGKVAFHAGGKVFLPNVGGG